MFAPHCTSCGHRVLLGTGRLVAADLETEAHRVLVRCFCGTVLDAFQESPPMAGQQPEPVAPPGIPPDPVRPRRAA